MHTACSGTLRLCSRTNALNSLLITAPPPHPPPLSPCSYISLMKNEGLDNVAVPTPVLQKKLAIGTPARCATADNSTIMDQRYAKDAELQELQKALEKKYQSL